jgi:hypothetical protein
MRRSMRRSMRRIVIMGADAGEERLRIVSMDAGVMPEEQHQDDDEQVE